MDKDNIIKLTLGLYQVTDLFPIDEPLRFFLREKANEVLSDSIIIFADNPLKMSETEKRHASEKISNNIKVIQGFFEIVEPQKWVNQRNLVVLGNEYEKVRQRLEEIGFYKKTTITTETITKKEPVKVKEVRKSSNGNGGFKQRSEKILDLLKTKEKAQVWEFAEIFPEVTKRTLRRDLDHLLNDNLIERIGEGKYTFYRLKNKEINEPIQEIENKQEKELEQSIGQDVGSGFDTDIIV